MYQRIRPLLFSLSPEAAHHVTLQGLSLANRLGVLGKLDSTAAGSTVTVMGVEFPNRVGLAAGLDKNGEYIDALGKLGFGHIEVGTVTPRPQPGNPRPRLFRIVAAQAIINRMGFNNKGVDYLVKQVKRSSYTGVLGINIGKNFDTPVDRAVDDYLLGMRKVYPYASYITINISSPNTPGLRSLQYGEELKQLLGALKQEQETLAERFGKYVPLAVKVAPDLDHKEIAEIAAVLLEVNMDGLIATNTTLSREGVENLPYASEQGGLSGKPLLLSSTRVIQRFAHHLQGQLPVIGVGGISSAEDAQAKIKAGAELVQVYTGLVYQGPALVRKLVQSLSVSTV